MDGADKIPIAYNSGKPYLPSANPQFMDVQAADVAPYFQLAEQYTFGDRMFQTNRGPSFPAHQFILSGTPAPTLRARCPPPRIQIRMQDALRLLHSFVNLIDPQGNESSWTYPCFEHSTLTDELNKSGTSWRYYTFNDGRYDGSLWSAPNAAPPNATACTGSDWVNNIVPYTAQNPAPVLTPLRTNNSLPSIVSSPTALHRWTFLGRFCRQCHWE